MFKEGHQKFGGRKKGSKNKASLTFMEELAKRNFSFMDEFISVYNKSGMDGKRAMLLKSADFIFPKLKQTDMTTNGESFLSIEQLITEAKR